MLEKRLLTSDLNSATRLVLHLKEKREQEIMLILLKPLKEITSL
jgi:hypothetical protein